MSLWETFTFKRYYSASQKAGWTGIWVRMSAMTLAWPCSSSSSVTDFSALQRQSARKSPQRWASYYYRVLPLAPPFHFLANLREDPTIENTRLQSLENGDPCYPDSLTQQIPWASIASSMWWLQILDLGWFCCSCFNHFIPYFLICSQGINWHSINCTWTCNLMNMIYLSTW